MVTNASGHNTKNKKSYILFERDFVSLFGLFEMKIQQYEQKRYMKVTKRDANAKHSSSLFCLFFFFKKKKKRAHDNTVHQHFWRGPLKKGQGV